MEPDRRRLAYYRCVRALDDISLFALQILDVDQWTVAEREEALSYARGVLSEAGLVARATRSLSLLP